MVDILKVNDCFNYKKPKNHLIENGTLLPSANVFYKSHAELVDYTLNCINDCKNLLKVQEDQIKLLNRALKSESELIEYNPLEEVDNTIKAKEDKMPKIDLDSSRILYHVDTLKKWNNGEKVFPIAIDMCLSRFCQYNCVYCYGKLQKNEGENITWEVAKNFLDDCKELGVKAISLVSDNESTCNPIYKDFIVYCKELGIDVALGSNGHLLDKKALETIIPRLTYLRFNISAGTKDRYAYIHGVPESYFDTITKNIDNAVKIKEMGGHACSIGTQMVLMPEFKDDIIPLAQYAIDRGVDYLVIKHCSDSETSELGVDYSKYEALETTLKEAESMSTPKTAIVVKWSKIRAGNTRDYERCYGPSLHLQISGTGLCAPCGFLFNDRYKDKFHIGNFCTTRFKDILNSDRYTEVMNYLASEEFVAGRDCGFQCMQTLSNSILDKIKKGSIDISNLEQKEIPTGFNFI